MDTKSIVKGTNRKRWGFGVGHSKLIRILALIVPFPLTTGLLYLLNVHLDNPLRRSLTDQASSYGISKIKEHPINTTSSVPEINWSTKRGEKLDAVALTAIIDKADAILAQTPDNIEALIARGNAYAESRQWVQAKTDYDSVLRRQPYNVQVKFNLSELQFRQKRYDEARSGFLALREDLMLGDLATYKVFLCDLWGGHEGVAEEELADVNRREENPSYYFENAAWHLSHKEVEAARPWLNSAANIYFPAKFALYTDSLFTEGYIPLPPAP